MGGRALITPQAHGVEAVLVVTEPAHPARAAAPWRTLLLRVAFGAGGQAFRVARRDLPWALDGIPAN